MTIRESAEDYLEQILMLLEKKGHARSVDIAAGLNVSKPSVSVAMKKLRENGYITMGEDNCISLTDKGYAIARRIYDRHQVLTRFFVQLGVPEDIALEDACRITSHCSCYTVRHIDQIGKILFQRVAEQMLRSAAGSGRTCDLHCQPAHYQRIGQSLYKIPAL